MIDTEEETFEFSDEPEAIEQAAKAFMEAENPPEVPHPEDGPVELPGGYTRYASGSRPESVRNAWVRELTGADEERIAKAQTRGTLSDYINAILEAGVERLGSREPTPQELQDLLIGDRDYLLMEISRATYGDEMEYEGFVCMHCNEEVSFSLNKSEDIPVRRVDGFDPEFDVTLRSGKVAHLSLPSGATQARMAEVATGAEANTVLLSETIMSVDGNVVAGDVDFVRSLGVSDRRKLVSELSDRMPGPQYNEVTFTHPACGKEIRFAVPLADLFPGL